MHRTIIHHHHSSLSLLAFEECHSMLDDAEEKAKANDQQGVASPDDDNDGGTSISDENAADVALRSCASTHLKAPTPTSLTSHAPHVIPRVGKPANRHVSLSYPPLIDYGCTNFCLLLWRTIHSSRTISWIMDICHSPDLRSP